MLFVTLRECLFRGGAELCIMLKLYCPATLFVSVRRELYWRLFIGWYW